MSQKEVYKILKELGGKATSTLIRERAKEKFPRLSLYTYVYDRLNRLMKHGYVTKTRNEQGILVWRIIADYPYE